MKPITIKRIEIYRRYGGDIDGIARMRKGADIETFGSELDYIWSKITSSIQDVELIEKGVVSKDYKHNAIAQIRALCDDKAFHDLTKTIDVDTVGLLDIIKDYQKSADTAVQIFKNKYNVDNILEGWDGRVYERTGKLIEEGLYFYAFHGIGLAAHFKDRIVDFDFAFFPEPRHDGFDLWRLTNFIKNQRNKYPDYQDKRKVEKEFTQLVIEGIIAKPILDQSTTLYFFKDTLDESQAIAENIKSNFTYRNLQDRGRNWFQRLFGFK